MINWLINDFKIPISGAKCNIMKLFVVSEQQLKGQMYSDYNQTRQRHCCSLTKVRASHDSQMSNNTRQLHLPH